MQYELLLKSYLIRIPNILITLEIRAVITLNEQHLFSMVYFKIKDHLYEVVTYENVLSWFSNFVGNYRKITQVK